MQQPLTKGLKLINNNMNDQLDATITVLLIFESAQYVLGNLVPIFRSVRQWLRQCGVVSNVVVGWRSGVRRCRLCVWCERCCLSNIPYTKHIVYAAAPRTSSLLQHWTLHHNAITTVLRSWRWAQDCPKHVELIQRSIKLLLLHLVGHLYYSPTMMMHGQTQIKFSDEIMTAGSCTSPHWLLCMVKYSIEQRDKFTFTFHCSVLCKTEQLFGLSYFNFF